MDMVHQIYQGGLALIKKQIVYYCVIQYLTVTHPVVDDGVVVVSNTATVVVVVVVSLVTDRNCPC